MVSKPKHFPMGNHIMHGITKRNKHPSRLVYIRAIRTMLKCKHRRTHIRTHRKHLLVSIGNTLCSHDSSEMARFGKCFLNVAAAVMMLLLILPSSSYAATYYVGDQSGWTYNVDLDSWLAGKTFYVGDVLVFIYDNTQHNVISVDANGYNNCSTKKTYGSYTSGNDQITLTEAGNWYFICSYHCDYADQKIAVTVNSS
ncbi:hypothetical protein BT93_B3115 [Corymbia citriodora subsp. variegata]|nr:hypothetical protein BT93_B3115 [Corymbia citriodora subsp. variegata]